MRIIASKRKERPNTDGWEQQLERGLPWETRKQKGHRVKNERQEVKRWKMKVSSVAMEM